MTTESTYESRRTPQVLIRIAQEDLLSALRRLRASSMTAENVEARAEITAISGELCDSAVAALEAAPTIELARHIAQRIYTLVTRIDFLIDDEPATTEVLS